MFTTIERLASVLVLGTFFLMSSLAFGVRQNPDPRCGDLVHFFAEDEPPPTPLTVAAITPGRPNDTIPFQKAPPYPVTVVRGRVGIGAEVNDIWVTRDGPTGLLMQEVLSPLFLTLMRAHAVAKENPFWQPYRGKKVLLLGEGLDERLSAAVQAEVDVRSVDLWYDVSVVEAMQKHLRAAATPSEQRAFQPMIDFYRRYKQWLVAGSVLHIPYADQSFDAVHSRKLLNNLKGMDQWRALEEMVRVVAVGGSVFFRDGEVFDQAMHHWSAAMGDTVAVGPGQIRRLK